jgi:hypothetical protein
MSQAAVYNPQSSRLRLLVLPREHGAWGILLIPLFTGAAIGLMQTARVVPLLVFTMTALALFCLRTPVESLAGTSPMRAQSAAERRRVSIYIALLGGIAAFGASVLLWRGHNLALLGLGAVAGALFLLQTVVRRLGRQFRMAAQIIGALGLTSTAAGAYYVVTGDLNERALALWFANFVFAGNQVHFVQLRIHGGKLKNWIEKLAMGRAFFAGQILMMLAVVFASARGYLPGLAVFAFVPILARGIVWFFSGPEPLRVYRLGITELAHAITFGILLIASFSI